MGQPAAKANDQVVGVDTHIVMVPSPSGSVPTPLPHPFSGIISGGTISSVKIGGQPAAVVDSTADNSPAHLPTPPGVSFQSPPSTQAPIKMGGVTGKLGGREGARARE